MNPGPIIPVPDTIPAPAWLFHVLDVALFTIHILLINIVFGGSLISFASRLRSGGTPTPLSEPLKNKLPVFIALAVNVGIAPLLFLQVIYGHLFYTSSVLMARFWIMIIPCVILGYYALYIHSRSAKKALATTAIGIMSGVALYVAFMFVNNMVMMIQPAKWTVYFTDRTGVNLSIGDPTLVPRYLHFLTASIAVAALFSAAVWSRRAKRGIPESGDHVRRGLFIFGTATVIQIAIGLWFLVSLRQEIMLEFMGRDILRSIILAVGFLCALGSVGSAFMGSYPATVSLAGTTILAMILTRDHLRTLYLKDVFSTDSLQIHSQYPVLALFLLILVIGLAVVAWMLRAGFAGSREGASR
jgi:hypothetical protein